MIEISASLLMPVDGSTYQFGCDVIDALRRRGTHVAPVKCGRSEPVRTKCVSLSTDELVHNEWGDAFLWTGLKSKVRGISDVFKGKTLLFIYGEYCEDALSEVVAVFQEIADKWPVDFGCIHVLTDAERERYKPSFRRLLAPFNSGVTYRDLSSGIPNLGWMTILGLPYANRIDRMALSRIVHAVWSRPDGASTPLFVQLTPEPQDLVKDFTQFDQLRQDARGVIGKELFKEQQENATFIPPELRLPPIKNAFEDLDALNRPKS